MAAGGCAGTVEPVTDLDLVHVPTDADLVRVREILSNVGGPNVAWGSKDVLEVLLTEGRLEAERLASRRIEIATWLLAVATIVLAVATVALIFVTAAD